MQSTLNLACTTSGGLLMLLGRTNGYRRIGKHIRALATFSLGAVPRSFLAAGPFDGGGCASFCESILGVSFEIF